MCHTPTCTRCARNPCCAGHLLWGRGICEVQPEAHVLCLPGKLCQKVQNIHRTPPGTAFYISTRICCPQPLQSVSLESALVACAGQRKPAHLCPVPACDGCSVARSGLLVAQEQHS